MRDTADDFVISDAITDLESAFPLPELLALDYFQKHRQAYYRSREEGWQLQPRNYFNLLQNLSEIHAYRADDAKTLAKAMRTGAADWRNSDATFAELIMYRYYVRPVYEGLIRSISLGRQECDIVIDTIGPPPPSTTTPRATSRPSSTSISVITSPADY